MIPMKSAAFRLAPPTKAPFTLAAPISSVAFEGFTRTPIENANPCPIVSQKLGEIGADMGVNLGNLGDGRCKPCSNGPHRLIGNNRVSSRGSLR